MKYIYFDCYAGFDVQMALGSLIDMSKNDMYAKKAASDISPGCMLFSEEVKRQSMDALLVHFDMEIPDECSINDVIDASSLDDEIKSTLKLWYKFKSDGMIHNFADEFKELVYCAACVASIKAIEADAIYVSAISQGNAVLTDGNKITAIPSPHTELLGKMADIYTVPSGIEKEILTPGGIALLYVMGAKHMPPKAHNVMESGYGAGSENLPVPNIVRCITAEDTNDELNLNFETMFSQINTEFGALAKAE